MYIIFENSEHDIFEEEVEEEDLFKTSSKGADDESTLDTELFSDFQFTKYKNSAKIFDDQDYGGGRQIFVFLVNIIYSKQF